MAWPPPPLPINFQNATVSLDTHPQAHNQTNVVINNDIVPTINGILADFNPQLDYTVPDTPTVYAMRTKRFTASMGTTDANGLITITSALFDLAGFVGIVAMPNYLASTPFTHIAGIRLSEANNTVATFRWAGADGAPVANTGVGNATMIIAWGPPN